LFFAYDEFSPANRAGLFFVFQTDLPRQTALHLDTRSIVPERIAFFKNFANPNG
jgi:hypothetical protein